MNLLPTGKINVQPGLRYIYNFKFKAPLVYSVNVKWDAMEWFSLRGSYAKGFRAPSIKELYLQFKKANEQQLDFGKTRGPLFGAFDEFLVRFQAMFNDSRYDFLFRPKKRMKSLDLEDLLRDFIGLGDPKRQITVIDLSAVPSDVRPTVSAQIGRLAFEFNYWNPHYREFPILLVCEEAHSYIPRAGTGHTQYEATRRAMEDQLLSRAASSSLRRPSSRSAHPLQVRL